MREWQQKKFASGSADESANSVKSAVGRKHIYRFIRVLAARLSPTSRLARKNRAYARWRFSQWGLRCRCHSSCAVSSRLML
jgi:hypothetical protein